MEAEINNLDFNASDNLASSQLFEEVEYPSIVKRYQAMLIDMIVLFAFFGVIAVVFEGLGITNNFIKIGVMAAFFLLYEPFLTTRYCTLGQYITKIRVRAVVDYDSKVNIFQAFLRVIFKFLLGWLSFVTVHFNFERRALHDLFSGSVIILKDSLPE